jgi:hypothetical protein
MVALEPPTRRPGRRSRCRSRSSLPHADRLARRDQRRAAFARGRVTEPRRFDTAPSRRLPSGYRGELGSAPDDGQAYAPPPSCKIRRSVCAELRPFTDSSSLPRPKHVQRSSAKMRSTAKRSMGCSDGQGLISDGQPFQGLFSVRIRSTDALCRPAEPRDTSPPGQARKKHRRRTAGIADSS